jgi:hypothetical protein
MLRSDMEPIIPLKFQNIDRITSFEIRLKLKNMISNIFTLVQETRHFEYDIKTKTITENFLNYLEKVCDTPDRISQWSNWIEKYGDIVITMLCSIRNRNTKHSPDPSNPDHNKLMTNVSELVDLIKDFHIENPKILGSSEGIIIDLLDRVIVSAFNIRPDNRSPHYIAITEDIDTLRSFVDSIKYLPLNDYDSSIEMKLIHGLTKIDWNIKNFVNIVLSDIIH